MHVLGVPRLLWSKWRKHIYKSADLIIEIPSGCCYHAAPTLTFPVNKLLGDESMYYKRRKEDENRFLIARKGDCFIAPH